MMSVEGKYFEAKLEDKGLVKIRDKKSGKDITFKVDRIADLSEY